MDTLFPINDAWRESTLKTDRVIPAGYTYAAQLIGHDMGSSVSLDQVPHVLKLNLKKPIERHADDEETSNFPAVAEIEEAGNDQVKHVVTEKAVQLRPGLKGPSPNSSGTFVRYNLIENPLTLETIYGPGPVLLPHLYDQDTFRFRIPKGRRIAQIFRFSPEAGQEAASLVRALYDERNRDTRILHEIAAGWMQFHNLVAAQIQENFPGASKLKIYALARTHCVRVWHHIISTDIMPKFVRAGVMALKHPAFAQDEVTLLHGVFRAFHSLPIKEYSIRPHGTRSLSSLMKTEYAPSPAEPKGDTSWDINWPHLLAPYGTGNQPDKRSFTRLCFSVEPSLMSQGPTHVVTLDTQTATNTGALTLTNDPIQDAIKALPTLKPALSFDLAQIVSELNAIEKDTQFEEAKFADAPLFEVLLAEAQIKGINGSFGPLGSVLFKASIEEAMGRVQLEASTELEKFALPTPSSLQDLLKTVGY